MILVISVCLSAEPDLQDHGPVMVLPPPFYCPNSPEATRTRPTPEGALWWDYGLLAPRWRLEMVEPALTGHLKLILQLKQMELPQLVCGASAECLQPLS